MKANYICPHCRSFLNVGDKIIIAAKNSKKEKGILLFSMELGDYTVLKHPSFNIEIGEKVNMYCPSCSANLKKHKVHNNLFGIIMQDEEDNEMQILFSGTYGEKCTYRITNKDVESFGKDAGKYLDLDNLISMS
ncbi:hypothetical protein EV201_1106 [Ancylomarina subtilis]|uniref:Uncharacterized protein n=1 Tax=Ancylomarina subtilis TaxID=1639035 RepID=A0A4Q7VKC0_9BACT|nr:hypothetical protein [Ancylomarina subtilis]RZT96468.1 hypothetical protein EV201_1106 [Ancylomarina subtilis]